MKMYKAVIEAITMDENGDNIIRTETQTIVPANSRSEAIAVACDMGQAMARSANHLDGIDLYFRITDVEETEQGIV